MSGEKFWNTPEEAKKTIEEVTAHKRAIESIVNFKKKIEDLELMAELLAETKNADNDPSIQKEFTELLGVLEKEISPLEVASLLSGPFDKCNAIVSIHAGAPGRLLARNRSASTACART